MKGDVASVLLRNPVLEVKARDGLSKHWEFFILSV